MHNDIPMFHKNIYFNTSVSEKKKKKKFYHYNKRYLAEHELFYEYFYINHTSPCKIWAVFDLNLCIDYH